MKNSIAPLMVLLGACAELPIAEDPEIISDEITVAPDETVLPTTIISVDQVGDQNDRTRFDQLPRTGSAEYVGQGATSFVTDGNIYGTTTSYFDASATIHFESLIFEATGTNFTSVDDTEIDGSLYATGLIVESTEGAEIDGQVSGYLFEDGVRVDYSGDLNGILFGPKVETIEGTVQGDAQSVLGSSPFNTSFELMSSN